MGLEVFCYAAVSLFLVCCAGVEKTVEELRGTNQALLDQLQDETMVAERARSSLDRLGPMWGAPPVTAAEGAMARGDALVDALCFFDAAARDRVRQALHHGVKQTLAVVRSGFRFPVHVVANGFIEIEGKDEEWNNRRVDKILEKMERPGTSLAKIFEEDVLPPDASSGVGSPPPSSSGVEVEPAAEDLGEEYRTDED